MLNVIIALPCGKNKKFRRGYEFSGQLKIRLFQFVEKCDTLWKKKHSEVCTVKETGNVLSAKALKTAVIMNLAVAVMALIGTYFGSVDETLGGFGIFRFYTTDSNLLGAFGCTALAVCYIRQLRTGKAVPKWVVIVKYCAVCCLTVTFLVTVFILTPFFVIDPSVYGIEEPMTVMQAIGAMLFSPCTVFHHLLCPIFAFVSLILFDRLPYKPSKCLLFALIPTAVYAAISITLNILKVWHGPYPFLLVYEQPVWMSFVWFIIVFGGAALISWLVARLAKHG